MCGSLHHRVMYCSRWRADAAGTCTVHMFSTKTVTHVVTATHREVFSSKCTLSNWRVQKSLSFSGNLLLICIELNSGYCMQIGGVHRDTTPHETRETQQELNKVEVKWRQILQLHGLFLPQNTLLCSFWKTEERFPNKPSCWSRLKYPSGGLWVVFVQSGAASDCLHGCRLFWSSVESRLQLQESVAWPRVKRRPCGHTPVERQLLVTHRSIIKYIRQTFPGSSCKVLLLLFVADNSEWRVFGFLIVCWTRGTTWRSNFELWEIVMRIFYF